jgi:hypothetical protein
MELDKAEREMEAGKLDDRALEDVAGGTTETDDGSPSLETIKPPT